MNNYLLTITALESPCFLTSTLQSTWYTFRLRYEANVRAFIEITITIIIITKTNDIKDDDKHVNI